MTETRFYLPETAVLLLVDGPAADDPATDDPGMADGREMAAVRANAARLLARWRDQRRPLIHIRQGTGGTGAACAPPCAGELCAGEPCAGEIVLEAHAADAFEGTGLRARLRREGLNCLVLAGGFTKGSLAATLGAADKSGFETYVVKDAAGTHAAADTDCATARATDAILAACRCGR